MLDFIKKLFGFNKVTELEKEVEVAKEVVKKVTKRVKKVADVNNDGEVNINDVKEVKKRLQDEETVNEMFDERRNKLNKKLMDKFIKPIKKEGNTE